MAQRPVRPPARLQDDVLEAAQPIDVDLALPRHDPVPPQSRTQSNACARARMALALGKLNFSCAVIGLTCMPTKSEPLNLGVPVVNFPRANAILAAHRHCSGYEIGAASE